MFFKKRKNESFLDYLKNLYNKNDPKIEEFYKLALQSAAKEKKSFVIFYCANEEDISNFCKKYDLKYELYEKFEQWKTARTPPDEGKSKFKVYGWAKGNHERI